MNKTQIRLTESDLHRIVKESVNRVLREGEMHTEELNGIDCNGFWKWFNRNAKLGWKIIVSQDGIGNNRAYNVYDNNDNAIGSWDEVDGWKCDAIY
jgi:hypothetical protein